MKNSLQIVPQRYNKENMSSLTRKKNRQGLVCRLV